MRPQARKKARELAAEYEAEMALDELREAREMTQEHLASLLGVKQPAIAKIERRTDMYLSTLRSIVRAMGGKLVIKAVFNEGSVEINQLRALDSGARKKPRTTRDTGIGRRRKPGAA